MYKTSKQYSNEINKLLNKAASSYKNIDTLMARANGKLTDDELDMLVNNLNLCDDCKDAFRNEYLVSDQGGA